MSPAGSELLPGRLWRRWMLIVMAAAVTLGGLLGGFVIAMDPYGLRVDKGSAARPLMDINQRYMYPQLVRSGAFDSAILGTSTMRLLDPAILSRDIGGRFANLAMNAATPWEQTQMAQLFASVTPAPATVIWGLDLTWCEADATSDRKRLTPRPFPPWLYDRPSVLDAARQINLTTLEIASRLASHRAGFLPERIRGDGYEVFTPPENSYDPVRARDHLYAASGGVAPDLRPVVPPAVASPADRLDWRFPAIAWLDEALSRLPSQTRRVIVLPPSHVVTLPRPGSVGAQRHAACKEAMVAVAARQRAILVDYAHPSEVTRDDENYWDPLHFRLPIARWVEVDLARIARGEAPAGDDAAIVSRP